MEYENLLFSCCVSSSCIYTSNNWNKDLPNIALPPIGAINRYPTTSLPDTFSHVISPALASNQATVKNKKTMPTSDATFRLPPISRPLSGEDDYPRWSIEVQRILRVLQLSDAIDHVRGREPCRGPSLVDNGINDDDEKPNNDKWLKWQDLTDKALIILIDSVGPEAQDLISGCPTAALAWTILKERYEGHTRTHLFHLFSAVNNRFDDRKTTLTEHNAAFDTAWLKLTQNVSSAESDNRTLAGAIKNFAQCDAWKATILLASLDSLPRIQPYINIIDNISSKEDTPTYANTVISLKDIYTRIPTGSKKHLRNTEYKGCSYCKVRGKRRHQNHNPQSYV